MVMPTIFKNKKIIILFVLIIISVVIFGAYLKVKNKNNTSQQETSQAQTQINKEDDPNPAKEAESATSPEISVPEKCSYDEQAKKIFGEGLSKTGYTTKTDKGSLVQCSYRKEDKTITLLHYEYADQSDVAKDFKNVDLKGYATKSKGIYTVSVLVINSSKPDTESANELLNVALGKL